MTPHQSPLEPLRVRSDSGRLVVVVPWHHSDDIHSYLRRQGIGSTLCLTAETREALLEVWPGASQTQVQAALDALAG